MQRRNCVNAIHAVKAAALWQSGEQTQNTQTDDYKQSTQQTTTV